MAKKLEQCSSAKAAVTLSLGGWEVSIVSVMELFSRRDTNGHANEPPWEARFSCKAAL